MYSFETFKIALTLFDTDTVYTSQYGAAHTEFTILLKFELQMYFEIIDI